MFTEEKIHKRKRNYYSEELNLYDVENLNSLFDNSLILKEDSLEEIQRKMDKFTELYGIVLQGMADRYISMTRFSTVKEKKEEYSNYLKKAVSYTHLTLPTN